MEILTNIIQNRKNIIFKKNITLLFNAHRKNSSQITKKNIFLENVFRKDPYQNEMDPQH